MDHNTSVRQDVKSKAMGRAMYSADFQYNGMLYARPVWAPAGGALIKKIDTSCAEQAPGVVRVFTASDLPGERTMSGWDGLPEMTIMVAEGEVAAFCGNILALVVAESVDQADRAVAMVQVEWEDAGLPRTVDEAKSRNAETALSSEIRQGDVELGFSKSDVILEHDFFIPANEHAYIEPESAVAYLDDHDVLVIITCSQDPCNFQTYVTRALNIPASQVRIHVPFTGGGFGGKHLPTVHVLAALAAFKLCCPVNFTWTREESMMASCKKQGSCGHIRIGLDSEGRLQALQVRADMATSEMAGAFGDNVRGLLDGIGGPYRIPNIDMQSQAWVTADGPHHGAFRGVARPDGVFVFEPMLTAAGKALGLDALEIRRRNWVRNNEELLAIYPSTILRNLSPRFSIEDVSRLALDKAGQLARPGKGKVTGRGFAASKAAYAFSNIPCTCPNPVRIEMFYDGSVIVHTSLPEIGEGITAIIVEFTHRYLNIDVDRISVSLGDTHTGMKSGNLSSSQTTVTVGNSIRNACAALIAELERVAGLCLGKDGEHIHYRNGCFSDDAGETVLSWDDFRAYAFCEVEALTVSGTGGSTLEEDHGLGLTAVACVCDVELDLETGEYRILQLVQAHDTGSVIHYPSARGQMLGGAVMAAGGAAMEEYRMGQGRPLTRSLAEYLIPTSMDVPLHNEVVFYEENPAEKAPYGAKGLGEHGLTTVPAALASAIYDACGVLILTQPLTPECILRELGKL